MVRVRFGFEGLGYDSLGSGAGLVRVRVRGMFELRSNLVCLRNGSPDIALIVYQTLTLALALTLPLIFALILNLILTLTLN